MKRYVLLALIGLSFVPLQWDVNELVEKLTDYSLKNPQEKIFVHFDKPYYSTGETIWFKAYLVDAFKNQPITLSNVVYVDLLNENQKVIDNRILRIENGGAAGDFLLPDSLSIGTYHVRAYTNWMRNYDDGFYFRKSFRVLKTQLDNSIDRPAIQPKITFFPEGGDLIDGLSSIVAIKSTDQFGNGLTVRGVVSNGSNLSVPFETDERGMGVVLLTPTQEQPLKASVAYEGTDYSYDLPTIKEEGYALRVLNSFQSEKITISIRANDKSLKNSAIIAHKSGEVFYSVVNQGDEGFAVRLDREDFPEGICHITFFDPQGKPQAERLLYANYPDAWNIQLDKEDSYTTRSKVQLGFQVRDTAANPAAGNLSVSITPRSVVTYPEHDQNIVNYLQLTSDLVGTIEQPDYYLSQNKDAFRSLDFLMMTQGWRRFKWDAVMAFDGTSTPTYWAEDGITYSGRVVDYFKQDVPRESMVSLSILNNQTGFIEGDTDENGFFFFSGNDFYDSTKVLFQAQRKLKKEGKYRNDVFIQLDEETKPEINANYFRKLYEFKAEEETPELVDTYLKEKEKIEKYDRVFNFDKDAILLDAVEVTGVKEVVNDPFESPFKVYGDPTNRIVADSIMRGGAFVNVYDLFQRIPGVRVIGSFPNQSVQIGGPGSFIGGTNPLYLLDGVNITAETLLSITPSSISHIDVLKRADAAIYGSQGANGVIAIYTKSGMGLGALSGPENMGILNVSHPGYSKVREFFAPDYSTPKDVHAKPDFRTTLYWNPTIITEGDSVATVTFYSSDQKGLFDVVVQGITVDGVPVFLKDSLYVE